MLLAHIQALFAHMNWADALVWRAVLATANGEQDATLVDKLHHLHSVQRGFLAVWRNDPLPPFRRGEDLSDLGAIARWARDGHNLLATHVASLSEEDLGKVMEVAWKKWVEETIGRIPAPTTYADTLMQVSQHSTYHRGQVNMRLRELGATPPLTDYIAWIWLGKPDAEWAV